VIGVVAERLAADDAVTRGFVLDGFPRTRAQADELQRLLAPQRLDAAVDIDVPRSVVLERMMARRREDDTPEAITRRLDLYDRETGPLLDFYEDLGLLAGVDGVGDPDEVFQRVLRAVDDRRLHRPASRVPAA
jgi:adenylate kinase